MRIKFFASVAAALSLAFIPTAAQAVATTLDIQEGGSTAVDLIDGDFLDVTVAGPIAKTGAATHELYSTWSTQSLNLDAINSLDITYPEGWDLEYTLDGTTWTNWATTAPSDINDVIAIRSLGDVNTVGENMFKTTSTGSLRAASFSGSGGGDGYNVAVGNNKVFNFWHHQSPQGGQDGVTVECHTFTGDLCATPEFTIDGYSSNHGSSIYSYDSEDKVFAYVMDESKNFGVLCVDYTNDTPVTCGFDILGSTTVVTDTEISVYDYQDMGSSSLDGTIIWSIAGDGDLMCFDMATAAACPDNGWNVGTSDYAFDTGRVTAIQGKVFFTLNDKLGCYDPQTNARCGGAVGDVTLTDTENRHAPFPTTNVVGELQSGCDVYTSKCIYIGNGLESAPADEWVQFFVDNPVNHTVGRQNAEQFAFIDNRFYYETTNNMTSWGSNTVTCFDFDTFAACEGFDGANREGIDDFYSVSADSQIPNCIWVNGDTGTIVPLNATTGEIGCDLGNPIIELPYDAVTPRMSCSEDGRVTAWSSLKVNVPAGVALADVRVSFFDSIDPDTVDDTSTAVNGWTELTPNASGIIDLSGLTTAETGTQPTIRIDAGDVSDALAGGISGTVTFVAEDPELCFTLAASDNCETTIGTPGLGDIADGIVTGTSITRPNAGTDVGNTDTTTLPGQNADQMCAATALTIPLPIEKLALTGADTSSIALGGFAVLAAGGAAVAVTRRRKA